LSTAGTNLGGAEEVTPGTIGDGLQEGEWKPKRGCGSAVVSVGGGGVDVGTNRCGIGDDGVDVGVVGKL
jgi:hypothetical protein